MTFTPKKLIKGQVYPGIPTDSWNAFCDLYAQVQQLLRNITGTGATASVPHVIVEIQNTTGDAIDAEFPVLKLGDPIYTFTDNPEAIRDVPRFKGETPDADTTIGDVCIVQGPIGDNEFRVAILQGPAHCEVDITDEAHTHARPKDGDNTKLESGTTGAKIRWKESGTGTKKVVIILGGSGGAMNNVTIFAKCIEPATANLGSPGKAVLLDACFHPIDADGEFLILDEEDEDYDEEKVDEASITFYNAHNYVDIPAGMRIILSSEGEIKPGGGDALDCDFGPDEEPPEEDEEDEDPETDPPKPIYGRFVNAADELAQHPGYGENTLLRGAATPGGMYWDGFICPETEE